ncbi:RNA polymerase sigma factor [Psychroflexus salis]|uniref:DNA-binding protein n=1 Tax=Psychroflexus salis TaxID=1526574 RepID=A0A916ZQ42_9FLAO|nr:sigma-70 family RNA polymerase sigma factor [Psychroflexus salis]GGE07534.1 DNA-binding protein [Psychroflexus salis]
MQKPIFTNVCEEHLFSKLHKKYASNLHDFIYYKFGNEADASDKVQHAFLKLWENCKDITPDKAKSFLFSVANNATLNVIKHKKVVLKYQKIPQKTSTQIDPQHVLEEKEYLEKFQKALSNLSPKKRAAFMMNRVEGKTHQEIADVLGVSKKAIEKRIYTALVQLKNELGEF